MELQIGISPCPNDTYIFDAIYRQQIDLQGLSFKFVLEDVETLNEMSREGALDIVKISYANYFRVLPTYIMMRTGSALGHGVGPLLIAAHPISMKDLIDKKIAIPGIYTTANFLLQFALPQHTQTVPMVFSEIENAVLQHQVSAGVIIHENRFTYANKGLHCILDLGNHWENVTGLPIPLGGIAIKRTLPASVQQLVQHIISLSVKHANLLPAALSPFITQHAQEMSVQVMKQHINLYVNEQSVQLNEAGELAVQHMQSILAPHTSYPLFVQ